LKLTRLPIRPVITTLFTITGWTYTLRTILTSTRVIVVL